MIYYPDYDRNILSISSSILKYYGCDHNHKTLQELDKLLEKNYKNIVVMLFDGLGVHSLKEHLSEESILVKNLVASISTVCPATTACAIPTIQSGKSPLEHAWIGWDLYIKELDKNVAILKNKYQDSEENVKYNVGDRYIPYNKVWDIIPKNTNRKVNGHYISKYSKGREKITTVGEISKVINKIAKSRGKHYIYSYWTEPDSIMHMTGISSRETHEIIQNIEKEVVNIYKNSKDTLIIVTADHGLIDVKTKYLEDYPNIKNMLLRKPSMDTRSQSLFIKEEYKDVFKKEFEKEFCNEYILLTREEALEKGIFGTGKMNPRILEFIGDYIAFGISDVALSYDREDYELLARHAGLTEKELTVPFIAIESKE